MLVVSGASETLDTIAGLADSGYAGPRVTNEAGNSVTLFELRLFSVSDPILMPIYSPAGRCGYGYGEAA